MDRSDIQHSPRSIQSDYLQVMAPKVCHSAGQDAEKMASLYRARDEGAV
jgi:hypothetical protein